MKSRYAGETVVPNGRESSPFSEAVVVAIGIRVRGPQLRHARRCDAIRGAEHDPAPIWGYADLHNHQLSNKGFGGVFMWGESFTNVPDPSTASALAPDIAWSLRDFRAQAAMPWCDFSSLSPIGSVHGPGHSFDLIGTIALGQGYPRLPRLTTDEPKYGQRVSEWICHSGCHQGARSCPLGAAQGRSSPQKA